MEEVYEIEILSNFVLYDENVLIIMFEIDENIIYDLLFSKVLLNE
jgi:hypothetical protein